ncbi:MAG: hypothetical protein ABFS24_11820 [Pseudomonadota bacterium]
MSIREIKVCIEKEQALYDDLYSAMLEQREYDGCNVMQYSEYQENGQMTAVFTLYEGGLNQ